MKIETFVETHLIFICQKIGIDRPTNFDKILSFMIEDVKSASGFYIDGDYHSGDVEIAFRRYLENSHIPS
jgi:hypothetical protein